ncbi:Uncharacterised protein (plasmid) [Mycoplasmopsis fermentans]|nr:Uncharacterised protein [Mycoplasmopsis fermentans]
MTKNTINAYKSAIKLFNLKYEEINKKNLLLFKTYLIENYKPNSVNLKIQALNRYLEFIKKDTLKLKFIKVQQKTFIDNVISDADYVFLKEN